MKITSKKEEIKELLSRKEVTITVEYEGATPTKDAVKELLVKGGSKADLTIVKDVIVGFKTNVATCTAYEYTNADDLKRIEALQMHRKIEEKIKASEEAKVKAAEDAKKAAEEAKEKAAEDAKKAAEEAKEKPAEEKPAEEAKEEEKAEEAKE